MKILDKVKNTIPDKLINNVQFTREEGNSCILIVDPQYTYWCIYSSLEIHQIM